MTGPTSTFTTSDGVDLSFRDNGGAGTPLVMLHGWGQTQEMFRHQLPSLPKSRVITLDFRGHGRSGKPRHGYRIARLAMDVLELLDHLELPSVDALGWSMGASVWWSFVDHFGTGRLRRLVVVDQPSVVAALPWMSERERAESGAIFDMTSLEKLIESLLGPEAEQVLQTFARGTYTGEIAPELWTFMIQEMRHTPAHAGAPLLLDHSVQDWRDVLPRIDIPSLVIGSEGSHVTPASQRLLGQQIPGARVHIFPAEVASSHFPFLQNPEAFNAVLADFLG
jgi:pimeloyl-ACP methyl ester carboxylesterase